jgi:hypothetical protein
VLLFSLGVELGELAVVLPKLAKYLTLKRLFDDAWELGLDQLFLDSPEYLLNLGDRVSFRLRFEFKLLGLAETELVLSKLKCLRYLVLQLKHRLVLVE